LQGMRSDVWEVGGGKTRVTATIESPSSPRHSTGELGPRHFDKGDLVTHQTMTMFRTSSTTALLQPCKSSPSFSPLFFLRLTLLLTIRTASFTKIIQMLLSRPPSTRNGFLRPRESLLTGTLVTRGYCLHFRRWKQSSLDLQNGLWWLRCSLLHIAQFRHR
jgi:hypothetical protein